MGKNLKGKDCGKDIYQRKDGLYSARFVDRAGKRHEKYFQTLPEARNWIEDAKYADKHDDVFVATDTTVDEWISGLKILSGIWHPTRSEITGNDMSATFSR